MLKIEVLLITFFVFVVGFLASILLPSNLYGVPMIAAGGGMMMTPGGPGQIQVPRGVQNYQFMNQNCQGTLVFMDEGGEITMISREGVIEAPGGHL